MALQPVISVSNSMDLSVLNITDITGLYDASLNPGGYGTPNTTLSQILFAQLSNSFYYAPSGAPEVTLGTINFGIYTVSLFPTTANPSPFILNENYDVSPSMLGFSSTTLPDGLYVLEYTLGLTTIGTVSSNPVNYFFTGNAECCIQNAMLKYNPSDCGCGGVKDVFYYKNLLEAAKSAAGCLKISSALGMLNEINQWCQSQGCNCK